MKAKRISLMIVILCSCTAISFAQEQGMSLRKSIKGGIVAGSFLNTGLETGSRPGFAIGLAFDLRLHNRFSLHPEITYIQKGGTITDSSLDTDFGLTMDYIEFPVLARYYFGRFGLVEPHLSAGPYATALVSTSSSTEVMEEGMFTPDELAKEARKTGWGVTAGIGSVFHFPFNSVTAEVRYGRSLSKAFERSANEDGVLQYFTLMIGFSF